MEKFLSIPRLEVRNRRQYTHSLMRSGKSPRLISQELQIPKYTMDHDLSWLQKNGLLVDWRCVLSAKITVIKQLNYNRKSIQEQFRVSKYYAENGFYNGLVHKTCSIVVGLPRQNYSVDGRIINEGKYRLSYHNNEMLRVYDHESAK